MTVQTSPFLIFILIFKSKNLFVQKNKKKKKEEGRVSIQSNSVPAVQKFSLPQANVKSASE